jgi:hypothetical protein
MPVEYLLDTSLLYPTLEYYAPPSEDRSLRASSHPLPHPAPLHLVVLRAACCGACVFSGTTTGIAGGIAATGGRTQRRLDAWPVRPGAAVEVLGLTSARGDSDSLHMGNDDRECIVSAW